VLTLGGMNTPHFESLELEKVAGRLELPAFSSLPHASGLGQGSGLCGSQRPPQLHLPTSDLDNFITAHKYHELKSPSKLLT
jgi:hypothetical protein